MMEQQVPAGKDLYLSVNYAVCQDIRVISSGLNLPLRGLVSWKGQEVNVAAIPTGADPDVGAESEEMVYLGISDFFLNSYAAALYKAEAMEKKLNLDNAYVKFWRNIKKIKHRNEDINAEIQIRELPIIHINREEGISVRPRVRVQFISGEKKPKQFQDVTVECKIAVQIEVKENKLTIPLDKIKCKLETNVVMEWLTKKPLTRVIKNMLYDVLKEGVPIPLPPNINLIQGPAHYRDGFMVLAGSVNWTAEAMKTLAEQMRDHVFRMLE
ncbi:hypothetical protein PBY51_007351 [Eleginops maclovinus]|nr:hypothetical protein PBY51_007351 [Eleginops maclovinus]